MASIQKRPDGQWRARFRDPEGKERARHFPTRARAQGWLDQQTAALVTGTYTSPKAGRVNFEEYANAWQASKVWRPSTRVLVKGNFERHVYPVLGRRRMSTIRPSEIQALVKGMSDKLAPTTVTTTMRFVSCVFRAAVTDRVIASSPSVGITLPRRDKPRIVPLTVEQLELLDAALPDRLGALVTVGAGLGLRNGEALGLTLDRVDFLRRRVEVDRQMVTPPNNGLPALGPLKTESSARVIPLPDVVALRLARHIEEHGTGPDGLLFTTLGGNPVRRNHFNDAWRAAVRQAGLPTGTRYHDLRHTYASALIAAGVSVRAVAAALGHADPGVTLRVYSHLWPSDEDRTRDAIDAAFGNPADFSRTSEAADA
jgi:integrase